MVVYLPLELINKTLSCAANLAPDNFYEYIQSGKLKVKKAKYSQIYC